MPTSRRVPARCRASCAAWCVRTSRSTTPTRRSPSDLRVLVRERLTKGDSDEQVMDFLVSRYGEFVLLKPTFEWHTAILWLTPLIVLLVGAIALFAAIRRRRVATPSPLPLDADEERQLREVLDKSG